MLKKGFFGAESKAFKTTETARTRVIRLMTCMLLGLLTIRADAVVLPSVVCTGWKADRRQIVKPTEIFAYMNGAGELYLAYGFKELYVGEYTKAGQPKITCELYLMPSSADAYGLFSLDRTGQALKIGQSAVYDSGLLIAWQGKFFIRVITDYETSEAKQCVQELAKQVVKLCGPVGRPPEALAWLPPNGLDPESVRYFHTHTVLNYLYFTATENVLDLSLNTNAVMGTYPSNTGKSLVLVIEYSSVSAAQSAFARFNRGYLKGLKVEGENNLVKLENGKWLGGKVKQRKILLVLESPTRAECERIMNALVKTN